jgi:Fe-S-cluster-containing dehydrogenase component
VALWGMVIDLDRCTGCQACVMACKAENNVPAVGNKEATKGRTISWMQVLTETDEEHHEEKTRFIPRPCLQCDDPPCTKVCPVYATYRIWKASCADLRALHRCRFCMAACPYNAKYFNWYTYQKQPGKPGCLGARKAVESAPLSPACKRRASERTRRIANQPGEYNTAWC